MRWIKAHKLITFLTVVIIATLIFLVVALTSGKSGNFVTRIFNTGVTTVEKPLTSLGGAISENISGIFSYRQLQAENQALKEENQRLKQQVINSTLTANQLEELKSLSNVLNYKGLKDKNNIVSANVISMDGTNWMNIFTIDAGSESGIKESDVVMSGSGLIGKVVDCGKGWSKVSSIIDESNKISFKVLRNLKLIGVVQGSRDGSLEGYMLDASAKVVEGDTLVTSGMGMYPAGIEIGKVAKIKYDSDVQLKTIKVKSSVEFKTLQKVSVII
ncbi:MAG: rod shape-determining protein MreC [Anaerovoracaceae bacterium]